MSGCMRDGLYDRCRQDELEAEAGFLRAELAEVQSRAACLIRAMRAERDALRAALAEARDRFQLMFESSTLPLEACRQSAFFGMQQLDALLREEE